MTLAAPFSPVPELDNFQGGSKSGTSGDSAPPIMEELVHNVLLGSRASLFISTKIMSLPKCSKL